MPLDHTTGDLEVNPDVVCPEADAWFYWSIHTLAEAVCRHPAGLWDMGDGYGGYVLDLVAAAVAARRPPAAWTASPRGPCFWCGEPDGCQRDHIVPRSRGGNNRKHNLRWLCVSCNQFKGVRLDSEISPDDMADHLRKMAFQQAQRSEEWARMLERWSRARWIQ